VVLGIMTRVTPIAVVLGSVLKEAIDLQLLKPFILLLLLLGGLFNWSVE
jgi:hypothetical protein